MPPLGRTAWLEIDLDAIVANLTAIRSLVGPTVRVEPVVKADAYGHGLVPVAQALEGAGADGFAVATWDEAVVLRRSGVKAPILVLYPVPPEHAAEAARRGITLTAGDPTLLRRLLDRLVTAARADGSPGSRADPLAIELEIETGLGRGGFAAHDLAAAAAAIGATPGARLEGAWSHLQAPADEPRSAAQGARFAAALRALGDAGEVVVRRHLAASGALLVGDGPPCEAVRPGLAIYGLIPDELDGHPAGERLALRPAMALRARPVRVLDLPAGWGISYGPTFVTSRPTRVATLPLGYGDGWPRSLSNRAEALVRGVRVPLIGTVAMDAVMADVTDVPGAPVGVDDEFTLIGDDGEARITAGELARSRTTISWEVVTNMPRRLARVYHAASGPTGVRALGDGETAWLGSSSGTATSATSRSTRS